jgi:hypothetical protein
MISIALDKAIREARRIRRNLVRVRGDRDLEGDCGLASVLLASAIGKPQSLRALTNSWNSHVWNVVDGTIVDITATQFTADVNFIARGVLVTRTPRGFHRGNVARGNAVLRHVMQGWYAGDQYAENHLERAAAFLTLIAHRQQRKRAMP